MGHFNKGGKFGGRGFGDRDNDRPTLHKATCTDCGKPCEVPFKPAPGKSVFCSDCFKREGDGGKFEKRGFGKKDFGRSSFEDRPMYEATCAECGNRCEVPFRPNGEKPVLCSECFAVAKGDNFGPRKTERFAKKSGGFEPRSSDRSNEQFEKLNAKLERILKLLETMRPKKEVEKETVKEAPKKDAEEKVSKVVAKKEVATEKPAKASKVTKVTKPKKAKKAE